MQKMMMAAQLMMSQQIQKVMNAQVEPLGKLRPEIPRGLQTIIHRAIDREPQHRHQSAQEFADDLQRFINDEPIEARRISSGRTVGPLEAGPLIRMLDAHYAATQSPATGYTFKRLSQTAMCW